LPWLPQDEDTKLSLREILATGRGRATVACNILAVLGMAPFLYIEVSLFHFRLNKLASPPHQYLVSTP
jgi:hypothetical protein